MRAITPNVVIKGTTIAVVVVLSSPELQLPVAAVFVLARASRTVPSNRPAAVTAATADRMRFKRPPLVEVTSYPVDRTRSTAIIAAS